MQTREIKILCPRCDWAPQQSSRWACSCRWVWNTFETGGVCPDCGKVWEETCCPSCESWSRHRLWYREFLHAPDLEIEEPVGHPGI